jgi:3-dehydroquinate dehydratase-2
VKNRVEVIHGVNLDMLGRRDPEHYGTLTLTELEVRVDGFAREMALQARFFHTNSEAHLVEHLHRLEGLADGILLNAGAWTHYAWSLRDALEIAGLPTVEIHLSDVGSREEWRRHSVFEGLVVGTVSGQGLEGYREALELLKGELGG